MSWGTVIVQLAASVAAFIAFWHEEDVVGVLWLIVCVLWRIVDSLEEKE